MKSFVIALCAVAGLAGCAVVPVAEPGLYVAPPPPPVVVVRPYYPRAYGHYGWGPRRYRHW